MDSFDSSAGSSCGGCGIDTAVSLGDLGGLFTADSVEGVFWARPLGMIWSMKEFSSPRVESVSARETASPRNSSTS